MGAYYIELTTAAEPKTFCYYLLKDAYNNLTN